MQRDELIARLDALGICASVSVYQELLSNADSGVLKANEIGYLHGFLFVRIMHDHKLLSHFPIMKQSLDVLEIELNQNLEQYGYDFAYSYRKGVFDARFLIERLGFRCDSSAEGTVPLPAQVDANEISELELREIFKAEQKMMEGTFARSMTVGSYHEAVQTLLNATKCTGTSGARVASLLLFGLYNGGKWPFDLSELAMLDTELLCSSDHGHSRSIWN
jgi:hypothetical protein